MPSIPERPPGQGSAPNFAPPPYPGEEPPSYPDEVPSARSDAPPHPHPEVDADATPASSAEAPSIYPEAQPQAAQEEGPPAYPEPSPPAADAQAAGAGAATRAAPLPCPDDAAPGGDAGADKMDLRQGRTALRAHQRGADRTAIGQLAATVPMALVSLILVFAVFSLFSTATGSIVVLLWLVSGVLAFHRGTESAVARHLLRMRYPTPNERARLQPVWDEVLRRAGVRAGTYELWVQESEELNAQAAAGHLVGVTRHSLERLSDGRLAAILAHELGHHVSGHAWAGILAYWYALPAKVAGRVAWWVLRKTFRKSNAPGIACSGCLLFPLAIAMAGLALELWWLVLPFVVGPLLLAWLSRSAELRADRYAAGLGFAPPLASLIEEEHSAAQSATTHGRHPGTTGVQPYGMPPGGPGTAPDPYGQVLGPNPPSAAPPGVPVPRAGPQRGGLVGLLATHPDFHTRLHHLSPYLRG